VVVVGEAAAGPAHQRHLDRLQRRDHVVAIAAGVGDLAVLADPDAFVDAAAQVLGELAVDVAIDLGPRLVRMEHEALGEGRRGAERHHGGKAGRGE
jgi:hypothetical protein